ncbi:hypothetical protein [Desertibacillus haloalkaliphilus]|uniref:hypothetical protein n=1 Tax=Desertibacillus haloalkaliphilus TaxID=1328930 RepID=UPI001C25C5B8|nr:hypothetical protein [Desertibacillus haloalkaliphilus]MBU8905224.1 hypothetical protein [Desertibacillus haloalkaliphilus]
MKNEPIVDFRQLRIEKQLEADRQLFSLYESFFSYLQKNTNLREKVRAKHLFHHMVGLQPDQVSDDFWTVHFEHWFAFDYRTVVGSRMFDMFIREQRQHLSKGMLQQSGLLFMMALEPYMVKRVDSHKELLIADPFQANAEAFKVKSMLFSFDDVKVGDVLLLRLVRSGFDDVMVGPYAKVPSDKTMDMLAEMKQDKERVVDTNSEISWRLYVKEHGVKYLQYARQL